MTKTELEKVNLELANLSASLMMENRELRQLLVSVVAGWSDLDETAPLDVLRAHTAEYRSLYAGTIAMKSDEFMRLISEIHGRLQKEKEKDAVRQSAESRSTEVP
jgi:hypothetical protein